MISGLTAHKAKVSLLSNFLELIQNGQSMPFQHSNTKIAHDPLDQVHCSDKKTDFEGIPFYTMYTMTR